MRGVKLKITNLQGNEEAPRKKARYLRRSGSKKIISGKQKNPRQGEASKFKGFMYSLDSVAASQKENR